MKIIKQLLFVVLAFFSPLCRRGAGGEAFCQKILKDTTFIIVNSFQPTIADAFKMNDMPVVKDTVPPPPALHYAISAKKVFTPFNMDPLKPAKMVGEPLTKLYSSLVKIGGGNYNTPYAEIFYNNLRSKNISYGIHLKHFSSKATSEGYGFSGLSDNQIELYGKKFLRKHTLSGNLDYNRNLVHYYGYDTNAVYPENKNATKQYYSRIGGNSALQSHYTDSIHANYIFKLKYYNLTDNYKSSENNLRAEGDFSKYYKKYLVHIPVLVDYYANKFDTFSGHSAIVALNPHMSASWEKWNTRIGMNIVIDAQQNSESRFLLYPNIDFNYNVVENIIVPYAGLTGGLKKNSLNTLSGENPFIVPNAGMKNASTKWDIYGGIKGSISKTVSYNARTSFGKINDMIFFVNDNSDSLKSGFNTVYDDVTLWNVHGELQYQHTEKIKIIAKGDYNKYGMTKELEPWHKPLWQSTLTANYNLKNKIVVNADVFVYGKRFSYSPLQGQGSGITITTSKRNVMKTIVDANLGIEYRYSKKLSAFLNLNNLVFARYYFWNNYPSYKFNFLAGVTMVF
ncbi:MAG: TonB-dependent receptor [Bacteroidetes bacterium]|nr:TonB-dependent receptor [Bacteroidota bacterium]